MKHKVLPPPTSVGLSQTLTFRSHAFYRFRRLLSVTFLLLLFIIPFSKMNGQGCSISPVTYATCNSSYYLSSPGNANCSYWWFECDASGGNANVLNGNVATNSLVVYPNSSTGNQTNYYKYYEVCTSPSTTCFSAVITVNWDYDLGIVDNSGTFSIQNYSSITYSNIKWYRNTTAAANIQVSTATTYTPTTSGNFYATADPSCGGATRTSINLLPFCASNTQCSSSTPVYATCSTAYLLSFNPAPSPSFDVSWFECNSGGTSLSSLGAPTNSIYVAPPSSTGNQTTYYRYVSSDLNCTAICTSAVITVKWDYDLEIEDVSGTLGIKPYSTATTYSGYQWILGGNVVSTSSTYAPTVSGSYTLVANASCGGTRTSNIHIYYAPNTQCSSATPTYVACSTAYNLSFTPASNYDVTWYECDQYGANGSILNGGSPTNSIYVTPSSTGQTYYYYYVCTDNYSNATCTSGVITVEFYGYLNITGGSTLPATFAYTGSLSYASYQWYRNGQLLPGANTSSYYATLPGYYSLDAVSTGCGSSTSLALSIGCGLSNTYSNYTFASETTTTLSSSTIVLDGTIIIDSNASLTISNCDVYMTAGSEIIVKRGDVGYTDGGSLQISYTKISSCGKWGGIYAAGYPSTPRSHAGATLVLSHSEIRDAYIGLFADNNAKLSIDYTLFENNYQHIDLRGFAGWTTTCGGGAGWEGGNWVFSHNTFNYLMENVPAFTPTILQSVSAPRNSSYRKQVNVEGVRTIKLSNSTFNCYSWGSHDQNAVEVYSAYSRLCYTPAFEVVGCTFNGDFNDAMRFEVALDVKIVGNNITGNINHGIEVFSGGGGQNGIIRFNLDGVDIQNNTIHNSSSTHGGISGVYISQVDRFKFINNDVQHFVKGLEFYSNLVQPCPAPLPGGYQPTCWTRILTNKFYHNQYGIVLAPEEDPIGTTAHNQSTGLTINKMTPFDIHCNNLYYNDYGIVGYGEMDDQASSSSGYNSWGNKFAPRSTNISVTSTSTYADIVYLYSGVPTYQPKIEHFSGPKVTSNITYYSSPLKIFSSTNNYSLDIEGVTVDQYNITDQINPTTGTHDGCWTTFNKTDPMGFGSEFEKVEGLSVFPNPFSEQLTLENPYAEPVNYMIYNTLGEMVKQGTLKATATETLDMKELATGCYYFKTYNTASALHLYTSKLIKTN